MVFEWVKINKDDTTSTSSRHGIETLAERFKDPEVNQVLRGCEGMFPMDVPKNTRFAINYFTSIAALG
jgi:pre-mRNA-splicing factor CWC22